MTLDKDRSKSLGALTFAVSEKLGVDATVIDENNRLRKWRVARVNDLVLIDQAADEAAPRAICVYFQLEAQEMGLGKRLKIEPGRLLYALRWLHKGEPPDLDLSLAPPFQAAPDVWFPYATTMLVGALQEGDPGLREWLAASP
jgi:hypothetical protein